jgi:hypothetical protein
MPDGRVQVVSGQRANEAMVPLCEGPLEESAASSRRQAVFARESFDPWSFEAKKDLRSEMGEPFSRDLRYLQKANPCLRMPERPSQRRRP